MELEVVRVRGAAEWRWDMRDPPRRRQQQQQQPRTGALTSATTTTATATVAPMDVPADAWTAPASSQREDASATREEDEEDVCGICRAEFDMTCPRAACTVPGDACPPVWGVCSHAFHMHCIMSWLEAQAAGAHGGNGAQQCPMCRADWEFAADS